MLDLGVNFYLYKAKNADIALAMVSIFNAVEVKIYPIICSIIYQNWYNTFCQVLFISSFVSD